MGTVERQTPCGLDIVTLELQTLVGQRQQICLDRLSFYLWLLWLWRLWQNLGFLGAETPLRSNRQYPAMLRHQSRSMQTTPGTFTCTAQSWIVGKDLFGSVVSVMWILTQQQRSKTTFYQY